ncbi:LacI family transcriptional regulator [Rhizobium sp. BK226]|uniref:LacI family DNA-binding transcriptional regulator n=1 Tax=Rhizobium sp. BK226 TaxID=2587075 RepID=UPI00160C46BC|nr:LacI family DNA-binding transcriptional regulator [Rhizobium sp. BK226]MBB4112783.1 LacI family transcriptional regulator [Rhizobium sp. BK226]
MSQHRIAGKPATVHDVARVSGVSTATVSRVFTGKTDTVAPKTIERVRSAANELGYTPSEIGRSLRLATTRVVVMIVPDATNNFCADVAASVEKSLKAVGLSMVLANTGEDGDQQDRLLTDAAGLRPHAIIIHGAIDTPKLREVIEKNRNLVFVSRPPPIAKAPFVGIDNEAAGYAVGRYFAEHGYQDCAVIHGQQHYSASRLRLKGFLRALQESGADMDVIRKIESPLSMEAGYQHGLALLSDDKPRAVFCHNDMLAYGVHRAATEKGLRIPEDLAIFGFDDNRINDWLAPWLTTLKVPALDFGPAVAAMLDPNRKTRKPMEDVVLPFSLTIRESA